MSGARFFLAFIVTGHLLNVKGASIFLYSKKGVTQGVPISMVNYGIGFIPLIKHLKAVYPNITQPWYSDDSGALGMFDKIGSYFNVLKIFGPGRWYFPKPLKSVIIVHPNNFLSGK